MNKNVEKAARTTTSVRMDFFMPAAKVYHGNQRGNQPTQNPRPTPPEKLATHSKFAHLIVARTIGKKRIG
ncbi:MAG: hypothetical protein DMG89_15525 [Acidobacteria bacterium]|nr:MAG: hypothetical protein DMG89_15525 [Acidobacteriota bacterium]